MIMMEEISVLFGMVFPGQRQWTRHSPRTQIEAGYIHHATRCKGHRNSVAKGRFEDGAGCVRR